MSVDIGHIRPLPQGQSNPLVDAAEASPDQAMLRVRGQPVGEVVALLLAGFARVQAQLPGDGLIEHASRDLAHCGAPYSAM